MAEKSSFFNSVSGDRQYQAEDFAAYFAGLLTNGVAPVPSTNLQVLSNESYTISVQIGRAFINGYNYASDARKDFIVDAADGVLNRKDLIVVKLDHVARTITTQLKKGTPSASPIAPSVQRDDLVYELAIAEVTVPKAATKITQANIMDTRMDSTRCGYINSLIQADTTTIFNDYQSWYNAKTAEFEQDWNTWFSNAQAADNPNKQNTIKYGNNGAYPNAPVIGDIYIDLNTSTGDKTFYRYMENSTWDFVSITRGNRNKFDGSVEIDTTAGHIALKESGSNTFYVESELGKFKIRRQGHASTPDLTIDTVGNIELSGQLKATDLYVGNNQVLHKGNANYASLARKDVSLNNHVNVPLNTDWLITDGTTPWTYTVTNSGLYAIEVTAELITVAGQWQTTASMDVSIWLGTIGSASREYAASEVGNLGAGVQTHRTKTMFVYLTVGQVINITARHSSTGTNPLQLRGFSNASRFRAQQITIG